MNVSIVGITGYSGVELLRLLHTHSQIRVAGLFASSSAGKKMNEEYPHLTDFFEQEILLFDAEEIMRISDLVFFATPSGISSQQATVFIEKNFPVIDLSGDFRLSATQYEKWYMKPAADPSFLEKMQYSLADLDEVKSSFIANPGCYATATLLALAPLVQKGLIEPSSIIVDAKSGLSGAGKNFAKTSHFSHIADNFLLYKQNTHQHIPEIVAKLKTWNEAIPYIHFQTSLLPITRGIFITSFAKICEQVTENDLYQAFQELYQDKPFIRIAPLGQLPMLKQVIGSNFCDIGLSLNETTQTVTVVSVIDNLVKGAAGQAIQNMNKMFGFAEHDGLAQLPIYP